MFVTITLYENIITTHSINKPNYSYRFKEYILAIVLYDLVNGREKLTHIDKPKKSPVSLLQILLPYPTMTSWSWPAMPVE